MSDIDDTLKHTFGFDQFKPGQRQVIETIKAGKSAASIFPTGAGKSLCYQLPAVLEQGMTLVVSPLLSLMKNQLDFLKSKNILAAKLDSAMSAEDYRNTLKAARMGQLKILMIAVERFKNERFRTQLRQMNVSLLVVDEAHCISEWGHNFRPDYMKIPLYQKEFRIKKVLLLTATATTRVIGDMCEKFAINRENVVQTGFYRKNLFLRILPVAEKEKEWIVLQPKSAVEVFEILNAEFDIASTAKDLANMVIEKEKKDIARLHAMIELFETDQCLAKSLSAYFGEQLDYNCKRCSVCMEKKPVKMLSSSLPSLGILNFQTLVQPLMDTAESSLSVALVTRFLCGISSPRLIEYKARQMPGFGRLESYPYKTVEKWVQLHPLRD